MIADISLNNNVVPSNDERWLWELEMRLEEAKDKACGHSGLLWSLYLP
jgi:hypothetical protein